MADALYHFNAKTGSRKTGQSGAAKYDYITRAGKYERARPDELVHLESGNMPSFAEADPRAYWAAADDYERANGRLFRSITGALPNGLSRGAQVELARSFAEHLAGDFPYTLAVHAGRSKTGPDNPHWHLIFSERVNDGVDRTADRWFKRAASKGADPASGGARKDDRTKPREWLDQAREDWATWANEALAAAGRDERVDHRTLEAQRLDAEARGDTAAATELDRRPQTHMGPVGTHRAIAAPSRRQAFAATAAHVAETTRLHGAIAAHTAELADLEQQRERAYAEVLATVPAEALIHAGEPIAEPEEPRYARADLAAELGERQLVAAVPPPTWQEAEAAAEPIDVPPEPKLSARAFSTELEERRLVAVPPPTWQEAQSADREIAAPPMVDYAAIDLQRKARRRQAAREAEAAEQARQTAAAAAEHDRRERERRAAAEAARRFLDAVHAAEQGNLDGPAAELAARQPRGLPWKDVTAELDTRIATDPGRYEAIAHGLPVGGARMHLETAMAERAAAYAPQGRQRRGMAETVLAVVAEIQAFADRLIDKIMTAVLPGRITTTGGAERQPQPPPPPDTRQPPPDTRPPPPDTRQPPPDTRPPPPDTRQPAAGRSPTPAGPSPYDQQPAERVADIRQDAASHETPARDQGPTH